MRHLSYREAMLRHKVEADKEFCLSCELGSLFRMLYTAKGQACQVGFRFFPGISDVFE